ncbi:fibropellin-1-like isoform X2 [Mya arenaria]|uniref:fibropellin-1-like isoform X2 n=1 Tax=Mya arenaria TaxID=6604 RepID=UPI0022DFDBDB|nr:fibropellin-1-like isoform X2 [Mya arenaria]XP_052773717.1 fibropellin-1-like isoform X2 [Mya arenaria]
MNDTQMEATRYIGFAILIIELLCSTDIKGYGVAAEEDPCKGKPCSLTGECAISRLGKCTCKKGFKFEDETNTKCVDMDECGSHFHDPCEHRGICHNFVGGYSCSCLQGWSNDSHCYSNVSSDTRCVPGYEGPRCQDSMCGHYGYSETVGVDDYRCICSEGWTHTAEKGVCDIDIDECKQSDACSDKGLCNNTDGSYACVCLSGWNGANCSSYNCTVRPCENGGTCVDGHCLCTSNWAGNDCSSYVPTDLDTLIPGNRKFSRTERW